ncbi:MAG: molecular chaperone HtpG [Candidatus Promineifilaceae bacterium]|nr:molecular chaperone HtpG [Candidatus Promineifilaceae bacterium]
MVSETSAEQHEFRAEIQQLLDILVHSLYKEPDIFLRELISNSSDALTRLHFETLTNPDVLDPETELAIHIELAEEDGRQALTVRDTGVGMTREELVTNLGTIAQSGAKEFLRKVKESDARPTDIIGQFGVGFYSVFMVADEVEVVSRSYKKEESAAAWRSTGGDHFSVRSAEKESRGTEVRLTLDEKAAGEFAQPWRLKQIVKKYSDYVPYPIYVEGEVANQQEPLWRKPAGEVSEEDYTQFYQQLTMDFAEPLLHLHITADAPLHVRSLLYVPANRERSALSLRREPGVKLYAHNVLIMEYCQDLLPEWLNFVDGVVDSEDLPLNVSRETIQNSVPMRRLARTIRGRVLRELRELGEKDRDQYSKFWQEFGLVLKEGLARDPSAKEEILPLLRFQSSTAGNELVALEQYIARMAEDQEEIYFVLGDSRHAAEMSPHLDAFRAHNLEVLYLTDPLDPFVVPLLTEYEGHQLRSVEEVELELPETSPTEERPPTVSEADYNRFIGRCVTTLGNRVTEVRTGTALRASPIRLVAPDDGSERGMERLQRYLDKEYQVPKRILEVNRHHPFVVDLAHLVSREPVNPVIDLCIEQLYENALVLEGLHPDPVTMLPRVQRIMELAAQGKAGEEEE